MKKFLSILLCVAMLCAVSVPVFAEGENTTEAVVSAGSVTGSAGETVTVPVSIEKNPGFGAMTVTVTYDADLLSVTDDKVTPGEVIDGAVSTADGTKAMYLANTAEVGKIYISVIKAENVTGDGVLFNIEFTAAASASGETKVSVTVDELANESADVYTGYTAAEGTVTFESAFKYGDVDGDGEVTVTDALMVLQHSVGKIVLADNFAKAADVDGTEGVSVTDALAVLQYAVGKITVLPIK